MTTTQDDTRTSTAPELMDDGNHFDIPCNAWHYMNGDVDNDPESYINGLAPTHYHPRIIK